VKVAIFGCGVEGGALAGGLASEPEVAGLILVSRDGKRAQELAERLATQGLADRGQVRVAAADGTDAAQLAEALRGADAVANTALPDSNIPVMRAALDVGAHYLDLLACGFEVEGIPREMTVDAALDLDADFRAAGLLALPNTGASPGMTDMLAGHLAAGMEECESALLGWAGRNDAPDLMVPFAPDLVYMISMPEPVAWRDGRLETCDLIGSMEEIEWPEPLGRMLMVTGALNPEVRTVQSVVPTAQRIEVKTGLAIGPWDNWLKVWAEGTRRLVASGQGVEAGTLLTALGTGFAPSADYAAAVESSTITQECFGVVATVTGREGGVAVTRTLTVHATLDRARAEVPWSNACSHLTAQGTPRQILLGLTRGEIAERGVLPSAGCLDNAGLLLERCVDRGFVFHEHLAADNVTLEREGFCPVALSLPT
jgi:saccharopine dehydrogenase-like NADP-dependent oxidoreductase